MGKAAPWLTFSAAMITLAANIVISYLDRRGTRREDLLDHRRTALFTAVKVIDHVHPNESFNEEPAVQPHSWDIQLARDAMNGILIYWEESQKTLHTFKRALGLHHPKTERPPGMVVASLDQFRNEVAQEPGLGYL